MKILVCAVYYVPDGGPETPRFRLFCEHLVSFGHDVTAIAIVPHYPSGKVPEAYRKQWIQYDELNGVNIIRIRVPSVNRDNFALRLLQYLIFQLGAVLSGWRVDYDIVLSLNPFLRSGLPHYLLGHFRRKRAVWHISDVYPDFGISTGTFRHQWVIKAVEFAESFCIKHSDAVQVLSDTFKPRVLELGARDEFLETITPYGINHDEMRPYPRDNAFAREHHLIDKKVVLYSGNIGMSMAWDQVIEAFQKLQHREDIVLVLVGDGAYESKIRSMIAQKQMTNVQLYPYQHYERVPLVLSSADVLFLSQHPQASNQSIPSKIFSYLACGRPILAAINEASDTWAILNESQSAVRAPIEQPELLANTIVDMLAQPEKLRQMGEKGRRYTLEHHSAIVSARCSEALFQTVLGIGAD